MKNLRVFVAVLVLALVSSVMSAAPVAAQMLTTECVGSRDGDTVTLDFDGSVGSSVQLLRDGSWLRTVTDLESTVQAQHLLGQ